jgi:ribosomal protein S12 methylthiotransferase accessory factor
VREGSEQDDREPEEDVASRYEAVLRRFGAVVDFDISGLDRLGIPVTSCSLAVAGRFAHHGNGYGPTPEAARVSGLGELAEGVLTAIGVQRLRAQARRSSHRELVRREGAERVVDPRTLCLPAGSDYTDEQELDWVPVERVRSGEPAWVPLEFVASESSELGDAPALIQPITNGLGAGLDPLRPVTHGLLEILQRHTNGLRFRALDRRSPVIEPDGLPGSVAALVERFRAAGVEPVLKHAVTELGVCSTYVMGLDDDLGEPVLLTACGEAAHPSAEVSLTKALLEYANSRSRKAFCFGRGGDRVRELAPPAYWSALGGASGGEPRAVAAMQEWSRLASTALRDLTAPVRTESVPYAEIVVRPDPAALRQPELLAYLLEELGEHEVLSVSTQVGDVVAAKTIVPGLEVEVLSYGRLGELGVRALLDADLGLVRVQPGPSGEHRDRVWLTEAAEERLGGQAWYSYAAADRLVGDLYPLYREPPRHSVVVGGP